MGAGLKDIRQQWRIKADHAYLVALVLIISGIVYNLAQIGRTIAVATQARAITYTEGVNAILATRPELWFHPVEQAPHFPTIYPLGYHALTNLLWQLTGLSVFQVMHAIGLLSALVGAVAIAKLIGWDSRTRLPAATGALLYALSPAVSGTTVMGRVDHLGVTLGLLALLYALEDRFWTVVGLSVASMYVKHSLAVFPAAIFAYWFFYQDRQRGIRYAVAVASIGLGILAAMTIATDGRAWLHLVEYNRQHPWLWSVFSGQVVWFTYTHAAIVGLLVFAVVRGRVDQFAVIFAIVAITFSLLTIGKLGSWVGYFLPVIAASAWLFGDFWKASNPDSYVRVGLAGLLVVQLALYGAWAANMSPKYDADNQQRAIDEIRAIGGPILAEDGTLYVKTGVGQVHEPLMMRFVYEYDSYNGDNLASDIEQQRFNRIILGQSVEDWEPGDTTRWHNEELVAVKNHYVRVWGSGDYYVYAPKR